MHYYLCYIPSYLKSVPGYKFLILDTCLPDIYIYVSKDERIRGYYSMPEWVREQKNVGHTELYQCDWTVMMIPNTYNTRGADKSLARPEM
jgi:hypothetical protein